MVRSAMILSVALGVSAFSGHAEAASFNCGKAKTPTEKTICGKATLNILDQRMGAKYAGLMKAIGAGSSRGSSIRAEQVWWLGQRDACGADATCLRVIIGTRIKELDAYSAQVAAGG
jgi:uncharacterized protein